MGLELICLVFFCAFGVKIKGRQLGTVNIDKSYSHVTIPSGAFSEISRLQCVEAIALPHDTG